MIPRQLVWVVGLYATLQIGWLLTIPPFEGPDEFQHYDLIRYVAVTGHLPDKVPTVVNQGDFFTGEWTQEGAYYWLLGQILRPTGFQDQRPSEVLVQNRHSIWLGGRAANMLIHVAPLPDHLAGGLLVGRLASVLFGLGTLIAVFAAVRLVTADPRLATVAACCVALVPQFGVQHVLITNDTAAAMWASLASVLIVWLLVRSESASWPLAAAIGVTTGLAIATKLTAGVILVAFPMAWWCRRRDGGTWRLPAIAWIAGLLATTGVAFGRNWIVFGDPLATTLKRAVVAQFDFRTVFDPRELASYRELLKMLFRGSWASIGWGFWTPQELWIQAIFVAMTALAVACVLVAIWTVATWRRAGDAAAVAWPAPARDAIGVMLAVLVLHGAAFLVSIAIFPGYSARYFLPVIVPVVVIAVAGAQRVFHAVRARFGVATLRWTLVSIPLLLAAAWIGTITATLIAFHFEGLQ